MRVLLVVFALAALMVTASTAQAQTWTDWAYTYDGSYNPTLDGWAAGGTTEPAAWGQDDGTGVSALKIHHNSAQWTANEPRYTKTGLAAHPALIYQMRFKIEGGAATPIPTGANVYYQRVQYNDGRSRLERCNNAPQEGKTGDDFYDPDMTSDNLLAPFSSGWHTITLLMVGAAAPGATNAGSWAYIDGQLVGKRGLMGTGNSYSVVVGIVGANSGAWGGASGDLWVDYTRWGFDDTADENGIYGWNPVPEPSSLLALGAGLASLACAFRRRIGL